MSGVTFGNGQASGANARDGAPSSVGLDLLDRHTRSLQAMAVLALTAVLLFRTDMFLDGDTGWHLGAGRWILEHRQVPTTDPFSFTFGGAPWTAHEWLSEIAMALAFQAGAWTGLVLLFGTAGAVTFSLLARESFRYLPARWALASLLVAAGLLFPSALARPHMLMWPLILLWTLVLLRAREERTAPPIAGALLMLLWTNMHASWMIGLGLAALFGLESFIEQPRNRQLLGAWLKFGLAAGAAALATPLGPTHVLYPFEVSGMEALAIVGEWRRSVPTTDVSFYICLAGLAVLIGLRWRMVPVTRLLLLAGLAGLAIMHARHQMIFTLVGLPVALRIIGPLRREGSSSDLFVIFTGGLALLAAVRMLVPYQFVESGAYPLTLLSKVPPQLRSQPLFNEYSQGGPLVMTGSKPYIDGRGDMYGDELIFRAVAIADGDLAKFREDVRHYDLRWALLQSGNGLVVKLDQEPGWRRFAADQHAVIFVRER